MLKGLIALASYGFNTDNGFGQLMDSFSQLGFFTYLLPFLLIFALVYGILLKTNLFKEKPAINGIIALAVGLMALQFDIVPQFFSEVFPRVAIGLVIILVILILVGLFLPNSGAIGYLLFGISGIIVIVILLQVGGVFGSGVIWWLQDHWPMLLGAAIFIISLIVIMNAGKPMVKPAVSLGEILPHFKYS